MRLEYNFVVFQKKKNRKILVNARKCEKQEEEKGREKEKKRGGKIRER